MSSLEEVREAIGKQIAAARTDLTYTRVLTAATVKPCVLVLPPAEIGYLGTFTRTGQFGELRFRAIVLFSGQILEEMADAITACKEATGEASVFKAVMDDTTLGGVIGTDSCAVESCRDVAWDNGNGAGHAGVEFTVLVAMAKESA